MQPCLLTEIIFCDFNLPQKLLWITDFLTDTESVCKWPFVRLPNHVHRLATRVRPFAPPLHHVHWCMQVHTRGKLSGKNFWWYSSAVPPPRPSVRPWECFTWFLLPGMRTTFLIYMYLKPRNWSLTADVREKQPMSASFMMEMWRW